jgi:hypothetical protein
LVILIAEAVVSAALGVPSGLLVVFAAYAASYLVSSCTTHFSIKSPADAPVDITLSLLCGGEKRKNPPVHTGHREKQEHEAVNAQR